MSDKKLTDVQAIKKFFYSDVPAAEFMKEFKKLTPEDKEQLGEGIRSGSMTY